MHFFQRSQIWTVPNLAKKVEDKTSGNQLEIRNLIFYVIKEDVLNFKIKSNENKIPI